MSRSIVPLLLTPAARPHRSRTAAPEQVVRRALLVAAILAASAAPSLGAQSDPPPLTGLVNTGIVAGVVEDTLSTPVAGAQIGVVGMRGHGVSEDDGTFRIAGIQPGARVVVVRRIGFRPESLAVNITAGTVHDVRIRIRAAPQWVAPVVVDARSSKYTGFLRGFYERRDRGNGVFFTAADIEERNPRFVTDLLRTVPGTRIAMRGAENVITFRGFTCLPLIWIDGNAATAAYLDPDLFDPMTLAGIEVYKGPATVPAALMGVQGKGACGVIALWTKRSEPKLKTRGKPVTAQDIANLVASLTIHTADKVETPAAAEPGTLIVEYPNSLLSAAVPGRVVVEFVVDTLGHPEMETFGTVAATRPEFTDAARRAVAAARFTPAMLQGRKVRQLIQLPFSFTVPQP